MFSHAAMDLKSDGTFVQQFVDNPYLIDGYRFDIGVYVALVYIDPLRVYAYDADWLSRQVQYYYNSSSIRPFLP